MYSFNTIRSKFNICGGVIVMQNQLRNNILSMSGSKNKQERETLSRFSLYLRRHNIYFETDITEDGISRITILFKNCETCPQDILEGCIYFYADCMEVRVYYSELGAQICEESDKRSELYRFLNFLHARLWPRVMDGRCGELYKPQSLFSPRFFITEDGKFDITATLLIPYSHYELDELQTEDFITAALPDLMNRLSESIFLILTGKITADEAIGIVKREILSEANNEI